MRMIATKKKPVFVQANSNSGQGHVLHYITSFWVAFSLSKLYFWLAGKTETKQVVNRIVQMSRRGWQLKRPRIRAGGFYLFFSRLRGSFSRASRANFAATPLVRPARQNRHATHAKGWATGYNRRGGVTGEGCQPVRRILAVFPG